MTPAIAALLAARLAASALRREARTLDAEGLCLKPAEAEAVRAELRALAAQIDENAPPLCEWVEVPHVY